MVVDLITWGDDRHTIWGGSVPPLLMPVLLTAVYATLMLRWRHPFGVFAGQWVFALSCLVVPDFEPFAGLLLALHAVAARGPVRRSVAALVSTMVPFAIFSSHAADLGSPGSWAAFAGNLVLWMLLATACWGVGCLSHAAARRAERLRDLQAQAAAAAVQAERMHLARELHDIVAHTVTIMMIQAAGAKAVLDPGQATVRAALEVIENSGVQAMAELHRMLRLLRMPDADPAALGNSVDPLAAGDRQPTAADIDRLVRATVRAGADVSLMEDGSPGPLDPSVGAAAYRVVQESLTNALKHGGVAATVLVRLRWSPMLLEVEVTDTEHGSAPHSVAALPGGHGLCGLAERVTMVGGMLEHGPIEGGYAVLARLPRPRVRVSPLLTEWQAA
jgi:signal transduction histidine kinase